MTKMTSTQRITMAAEGKEPDRVPISGLGIIGMALVWEELFGPDSWMDYGRDAKKLAEAMVYSCKELGFDAIAGLPDSNVVWEAIAEASGLGPYPATHWQRWVGQGPHRLYEGDPLKDILFGNPLVKTMKDALKLVPADPYKHGRFPAIIEATELANKELEGKWGVGGFSGAIWDVGCLMGWTQMFMAMRDDLELWKAVEEVAIETCYQITKAMVKAGATSLGTVSLLPQWVGPEMFLKNPVWVHADHPPELFERIYKEFHIGVGIHPCTVGPWEHAIPVWKKWVEEDHVPSFMLCEYGGADAMARAKKELAPATVVGNLHPLDVMMYGSPADVEAACKELIKKCGPGGRFILQCSDFPPRTPIENLKAMRSAVEKYGYYPIEVEKL